MWIAIVVIGILWVMMIYVAAKIMCSIEQKNDFHKKTTTNNKPFQY